MNQTLGTALCSRSDVGGESAATATGVNGREGPGEGVAMT